MIAREGLVPIGAVLVAAAVVSHFAGVLWALPLWGVGAYFLYLFREPLPAIPNLPLAILSPGDGRVMDEGREQDSWLERDSRRCRGRSAPSVPGVNPAPARHPVHGPRP